jgi:hypothetical protein
MPMRNLNKRNLEREILKSVDFFCLIAKLKFKFKNGYIRDVTNR